MDQTGGNGPRLILNDVFPSGPRLSLLQRSVDPQGNGVDVRRLRAHLSVQGPDRGFLARRVLRQFPRAGGPVGGEPTRSRERERRRSNQGFLLAPDKANRVVERSF